MLKPQQKEIDSVDIDEEGIITKHSTSLKSFKVHVQPATTSQKVNLPPLGCFTHPPLLVGQAVYAMRCNSFLASWDKGCIKKVTYIFTYFFTNIFKGFFVRVCNRR